MGYKWMIMKEQEDTDAAYPYESVDTADEAETRCYELEKENPGFIFWTLLYEEEEE